MSVAVFIVCLLCLGWTLRLVGLLETELRDMPRSQFTNAALATNANRRAAS